MQVYPEEYQKLIADPEFEANHFTVTYTDVTPIYAKDFNLRQLGGLHAMFNQALWDRVPAGSKDYYRKQTTRMLAIDDPSYRPRVADPIKIVNTGQGVQADTPIHTAADQNKVANVLKKFGVANIPCV